MGKNKKRYRKEKMPRREFLTDKLRIPPDVSLDEIKLSASGNQRLWVENYRSVMDYTKKRLVILGKGHKITIEGENLKMEYFTKEDLLIRGEIRTICYDFRERDG